MFDRTPSRRPDDAFAGAFARRPSQRGERLVSLTRFSFPVAASFRERAAAERIAQRAQDACELLHDALGVTPEISLLVLGRDDWRRHAATPSCGVTHLAQNGTLIVGAEPADAWRSVSRHLARHLPSPALAELVGVHGVDRTAAGGPSLGALAETLIAHEIAHIVATQADVAFPNRWLGEAFANYALVAVLGETDPAGLRLVGSLAEAAATLDGAMPTLAQFEAHFGRMDVVASVFAELAITRAVYAAYAAAGIAPLTRLFELFRGAKLSRDVDCELAGIVASRVHPAVSAIPTQFSSAPRIGLAA